MTFLALPHLGRSYPTRGGLADRLASLFIGCPALHSTFQPRFSSLSYRLSFSRQLHGEPASDLTRRSWRDGMTRRDQQPMGRQCRQHALGAKKRPPENRARAECGASRLAFLDEPCGPAWNARVAHAAIPRQGPRARRDELCRHGLLVALSLAKSTPTAAPQSHPWTPAKRSSKPRAGSDAPQPVSSREVIRDHVPGAG